MKNNSLGFFSWLYFFSVKMLPQGYIIGAEFEPATLGTARNFILLFTYSPQKMGPRFPFYSKENKENIKTSQITIIGQR